MSFTKKKAGLEFEHLVKKVILVPPEELVTPENFLKKPLTIFKDCSKKIAETIEHVYRIKNVQELAKWSQDFDSDKMNDFIDKTGLTELALETWIILAKMAVNIKDLKRSDVVTSKIIFAGLGSAGKTSLIQSFIFKSDSQDALNTKPTLGMDSHKINYPDGNLLIWELGGQSKFHDMYFANPENYFLSINALVYIIDVQNPARFNESCVYFIQILEVLARLGQKCHVILLFHKCDPIFMGKIDFLKNIESLRKLFISELNKRKFSYLVRYTSVYYSREELESLLDKVLDIKLLSAMIMKLQENHELSEKSSLKEHIKSLFNRKGKDKNEFLNDFNPVSMPNEKVVKEIELENAFHLMNSDAFKNAINKKNYDIAAPTIEYFIDSWNKFKNIS
jgi:GTPase SAR1 family protein